MIVLFQVENLIYSTIRRVFSGWRISGSLDPGNTAGCEHLICDLCKAMEAQVGGDNNIAVPALFKAKMLQIF